MTRRDRPDEFLYLLLALCLGAWSYGWTLGSPDGWAFTKRDAETFRFVTWNVGSSTGTTGAPLREEHLDAVAETLRRLEPDLVLLQEVADQAQVEQLLEALESSAHFERFRGFVTPGSSRRLAALGTFRSRRAVRALSQSDGRPLLRVDIRFEGRPITVVGVHADAYSADLRNRSLGNALQVLLDGRPAFGLLAGDFNLDLDLDKRGDLFTDDEYRDVETYNYLCERMVDLTLGTGSTAEPDRRLDYVLATEGGWTSLGAGPWRGQRVGDMDHEPVVADLTFDE